MNINDTEGLIVGTLLNTLPSIVNPTSKVLSTDSTGKVILVDDVFAAASGGHPTIEGLTVISSTGTQNNVPLPVSNGYRFTGASDALWTGLVAGVAGQKLTIWNNSNNNLRINHLDSGSSVNNRFMAWDNNDCNIKKGGVITIQYSSVMSKWIVISTSQD